MAMIDKPPVIKKVKEPQDDKILDFLKSIDSGIDDFSSFNKNRKRRVDNPIDDIKDLRIELSKFEKFVNKDLSNTGMSEKNYKKYIELQTKALENFSESIKDSIDDFRKSILSKKGDLTKADITNLKKVDEIEESFEIVNPISSIEDPLRDLKDNIKDFVTMYDDLVIEGLSKKDRKNYIKEQSNVIKEKREEIKENLDEEYKKILSKGVLTEEDKQSLKEIGNFRKALKDYGVKQETIFSKFKEKLKDKSEEGRKDLLNAAQGLLGPINLALQPLQSLFGFDFADMFGFFKKDDEFTKKGRKIKPRKSDILKSNPEIIYLANELKGIEDKTQKKDGDGFSVEDFVMGNMISKLLPSIMSSTIAFIASPAGIALMAVALGALGIKLLGDANQKRREDEARAEMGDFMEETGMSASQIVELRNDIPRSIRGGFSREDVEAKTEQVVEYFKITPEEYLKYVEEDPNNIGEKEEYISYIKDYIAKKNSERVVDEEAEIINKAEIPEPPKFHNGGFVPGNKNEEVPSILLGGEYVKSHKEIEFDKSNMAVNLSSIAKSMQNYSRGDDIVEGLREIVETIKNKPFNNVITQIESQKNNFDRLRRATI